MHNAWALCSGWLQFNVTLYLCDDIISFQRNVINTRIHRMETQNRKLGLQDPIWSQGWRSCEVTHDRLSHFTFQACSSLPAMRKLRSLYSVILPQLTEVCVYSGQHRWNFIGRSSLSDLGTCLLWVPWASSYLVQTLHQLALAVHLTDGYNLASGSSFWHPLRWWANVSSEKTPHEEWSSAA